MTKEGDSGQSCVAVDITEESSWWNLWWNALSNRTTTTIEYTSVGSTEDDFLEEGEVVHCDETSSRSSNGGSSGRNPGAKNNSRIKFMFVPWVATTIAIAASAVTLGLYIVVAPKLAAKYKDVGSNISYDRSEDGLEISYGSSDGHSDSSDEYSSYDIPTIKVASNDPPQHHHNSDSSDQYYSYDSPTKVASKDPPPQNDSNDEYSISGDSIVDDFDKKRAEPPPSKNENFSSNSHDETTAANDSGSTLEPTSMASVNDANEEWPNLLPQDDEIEGEEATMTKMKANNDNSYTSLDYSKSETTNTQAPLKVFVLAGQSNMIGKGVLESKDTDGNYKNGTLAWMIQEFPDQFGKLGTLDTSLKFNQKNNVWITFNRQESKQYELPPEVHMSGPLVPGFGGEPGDGKLAIGPELGFGWTLGEALDNNDKNNNNQPFSESKESPSILLIKVAWGGRSLYDHFRPPSAGGTIGPYYINMVEHVRAVLKHLPSMVDGYTPQRGYSLEGFVWFQGFTDGTVRKKNKHKEHHKKMEAYESNLANLIRDLRNDWQSPNLPVVIGVTGQDGYDTSEKNRRIPIVNAQWAVANATKYPEFEGTVQTVETRDLLSTPENSPGGGKVHWYGNSQSYWHIGERMGKAMLELVGDERLRR